MRKFYNESDALSYAMHEFLFLRLLDAPEKIKDLRARMLYWMDLGNTPGAQIYYDEWLKAFDEGISGVESIVFDMTD